MTHSLSLPVCQRSNKDSKSLSHQLMFYAALKTTDFEVGRQRKEKTESESVYYILWHCTQVTVSGC